MVQDSELIKAVSNIIQRAERQQDLQKIIATYVEVGILPQIKNRNNQIIYGRRGTGKTHIFKYLESEWTNEKYNVISYIDARTLGSSPQYIDSALPRGLRCSLLFTDIVNEIYSKLLHNIVNEPNENANTAYEALEDFRNSVSVLTTTINEKNITERELEKKEDSGKAGLTLNPQNIGVKLGTSNATGEETEKVSTYKATEEEKILFPDLNVFLKEVLELANINLYVLIDEWATIPLDLQPFLAEFIKRAFFANPRATIKIAALEYRSNFTITKERNIIGFELGSDISTNLDLDDYFVYDRNPKIIMDNFSSIIYKHIKNELPENYLETTFRINSSEQFVSSIFTNEHVFDELVRASEGVIRDAINIFTIAFFDAQRSSLDKINKKTVVESSRQWFERDKSSNLDSGMQNILRRIVDEVIGKKKARSFLIPRELEKHESIQRLFDSRVLHFIKRGYADKDNPGIRYNIYTLDYGTYVDLMNTSMQPDIKMFNDKEADPEFVVPFDDKRSIRRIILREDILN